MDKVKAGYWKTVSGEIVGVNWSDICGWTAITPDYKEHAIHDNGTVEGIKYHPLNLNEFLGTGE